MVYGWIILALGVILHILRESSIDVTPILGSHFFKLSRKSHTRKISVTRVANIQLWSWKFISPVPTILILCQIYASHIIFLVLWLLKIN